MKQIHVYMLIIRLITDPSRGDKMMVPTSVSKEICVCTNLWRTYSELVAKSSSTVIKHSQKSPIFRSSFAERDLELSLAS